MFTIYHITEYFSLINCTIQLEFKLRENIAILQGNIVKEYNKQRTSGKIYIYVQTKYIITICVYMQDDLRQYTTYN